MEDVNTHIEPKLINDETEFIKFAYQAISLTTSTDEMVPL